MGSGTGCFDVRLHTEPAVNRGAVVADRLPGQLVPLGDLRATESFGNQCQYLRFPLGQAGGIGTGLRNQDPGVRASLTILLAFVTRLLHRGRHLVTLCAHRRLLGGTRTGERTALPVRIRRSGHMPTGSRSRSHRWVDPRLRQTATRQTWWPSPSGTARPSPRSTGLCRSGLPLLRPVPRKLCRGRGRNESELHQCAGGACVVS